MPVQITITGENANQAIEEFAILTASFTARVQEVEKPKRQRKADKPEIANEPETAKDTQNDLVEVEKSKVLSSEELKEAVMKICDTSEKKSAAKALLKEFGSKGIGDIPEERRADFLARLEAL